MCCFCVNLFATIISGLFYTFHLYLAQQYVGYYWTRGKLTMIQLQLLIGQYFQLLPLIGQGIPAVCWAGGHGGAGPRYRRAHGHSQVTG